MYLWRDTVRLCKYSLTHHTFSPLVLVSFIDGSFPNHLLVWWLPNRDFFLKSIILSTFIKWNSTVRKKKKQGHSLIISKHRQKSEHCVTAKITKYFPLLAHISDCSFFSIYGLSLSMLFLSLVLKLLRNLQWLHRGVHVKRILKFQKVYLNGSFNKGKRSDTTGERKHRQISGRS